MWLIGFRNEVFRFIDRWTGNVLAVGLEMYFKEIKIYYNNNNMCTYTLQFTYIYEHKNQIKT